MTAHINIVHKLCDRTGVASGYMVKNGHGTPDEYRLYDAEGNFLYGIVDRQPWTVFRIFGHDGRLIYVGCTRTKNLRKQLGRMKLWKGKHTKAYQRALERGKRPPKRIKPFDRWHERGRERLRSTCANRDRGCHLRFLDQVKKYRRYRICIRVNWQRPCEPQPGVAYRHLQPF